MIVDVDIILYLAGCCWPLAFLIYRSKVWGYEKTCIICKQQLVSEHLFLLRSYFSISVYAMLSRLTRFLYAETKSAMPVFFVPCQDEEEVGSAFTE